MILKNENNINNRVHLKKCKKLFGVIGYIFRLFDTLRRYCQVTILLTNFCKNNNKTLCKETQNKENVATDALELDLS